MSEITIETGELAVCVNCQLKHAVGLLHHIDPILEKEKYSKSIELINEIREGLMMTSQEVEDFIVAYELEHKVEDALTVLRDLRHKIMEGSEKRFETMEEAGLLEEVNNPVPMGAGNPGNPESPEHCKFTKESVKAKEYFDPDSFRTICPECPESRCSLCPPELACATRIVTGCKEGEFVNGRCRIGTEAHTIYHGTPKRGTGRMIGTAKEPTGPEGYLTEEERSKRHILHHSNPGNPGAWESEIVPGVGFKEPTYSFSHCEKVEKSRIFGKDVFTGTNCAIETIGKPIKCKLGDLDKICVESINLYDESPPTHLKKKGL